MKPDKMAKLDQAMAELSDSWPSFLWRFYNNALKEGFDADAALELTIAFLRVCAGRS